ncbi:MAG TPA: tetratricopeptide repeat protein [Candidatus Eisenbacteria bacterium]|nr:tetratricopeptide repeat protein [Candidatus Eisenbacteria bacterium]
MRRATIGTLAALLALALLGASVAPASAAAEPKPKNEGPPPAKPKIMISSPNGGVVVVPAGDEDLDSEGADVDSVLGGLPRTYQMLVRRFGTMSPADSLGNGAYRLAETAFTSGKFDDAGKAYLEFARRYPRNLRVNDALSTMLLIKEARDFEDKPLLLYARGRAYRDAGEPDSAAAVLTEAAERYPGAKVRSHVRLMLAEMARDRGDHARALQWAVAAADTASKSRLAPYALKIAAESSLALGEPPQKALGYYKTILEKYPQSPVTPEARARALSIRKKMPQ